MLKKLVVMMRMMMVVKKLVVMMRMMMVKVKVIRGLVN
jgi:hypothetical protein